MNLDFTWFRCVAGSESKRGVFMTDDVTRIVSTAAVHDGDKRDLPMWSWARYRDDSNRLEANVVEVTALAIDVDADHGFSCVQAFGDALRRALDLSWCVHSSFSSAPGRRKYRAIAPVSRPIPVADYKPRVWPAVNAALTRGGIRIDGQCKNASRAYFCPAAPPDGSYEWLQLDGAVLDVDRWTAIGARLEQVQAQEREPRKPLVVRNLDTYTRAEKYAAAVPGAVSGQHGHATTFILAAKLVQGFCLGEDEALSIMTRWNLTCSPPWAPHELKRKVSQAMDHSRMTPGFLAAAEKSE